MFTVDKESDLAKDRINDYNELDFKYALRNLNRRISKLVSNNYNDFKQALRECYLYIRSAVGIEVDIDKIKDLNALMDKFYEFPCMYNWINIRILEEVEFSFTGAMEEIEQYRKKTYSRKLTKPEVRIFDSQETCFVKVEEKWKRSNDDMTVQSIINHWNYIEDILNLDQLLLLQCIKLTHDWVEIIYLLHSSHKELSNYKERFHKLTDDVIYLVIDNILIRDTTDCLSKLLVIPGSRG